MKITSLEIGGKAVSQLLIDNKKVAIQQVPAPDCLCFTAEQAGSTVQLTANGSVTKLNLLASTDGGKTFSAYTYPYDTITLPSVGSKVYLKANGSNSYAGSSASAYHTFKMTGKVAASGNLNSILREDLEQASMLTMPSYAYYNLFKDCSALTKPPRLPSARMGQHCYRGMFLNCTSLLVPPALPAYSLATSCYNEMFGSCTSMTYLPQLPATTLQQQCYANMFDNCSSVTQAPELPATKMADYCYGNMFGRCTSLEEAPELPATALAANCYTYMFKNCESLNTTPAITTTSIASNCCSNMFMNCTGLTTAEDISLVQLYSNTNVFQNMFANCTSLTYGEVVFNFSRCTSVPSLASSSMFEVCGAEYFIVVPDELYDDFIGATNWCNISDRIITVSEREEAGI